MAGIYIHVPFCKQRCTYCDFYTEVAPNAIQSFVDNLLLEIHARKNYLDNATVETIYLGGGTPSVLNFKQLTQVFDALKENFIIHPQAEITIEANPDDLTTEYCNMLQTFPINRLSMGIQSFADEELKFVNRRHNASQAIEAVVRAQKAGFSNISIDLIYGLPNQTIEQWKRNVQQALALGVQHISAYGLTYEEGTKLWKQRAQSLVVETPDELMIEMSDYLRNTLRNEQYEAYEISNFALHGFRSRHNSAYWKMIPYLGIGPSAHSYDGKSRQWNVSSIKKYNHALTHEQSYFELEILTQKDNYNDYVMVGLRTHDGVDTQLIARKFGANFHSHCLQKAQFYLNEGFLVQQDAYIRLTDKGFNICNRVIVDLMAD